MSARPLPSSGPEAPDTARLQAAETEAARRSFLRMMSHELRTPLNSIIGFADILSSELYGPLGAPQYREYAEIIGVSGQKLLNLVNSALEIIRLESETLDVTLVPCQLDEAVDDACLVVGPDAEARRVRIAFDPPSPGPRVLADARALRTVAANLIQNAVTWSPEGGVVMVTIEPVGPNLRLTVRDEGEGAEPADIARLMRPFEQGDQALNRRNEGAGLGWPLVRLWVRAMHGEFRVETSPGAGLTATVTLRAAG